MSTFFLVGCGSKKLGHPAPAEELYTGTLFRDARAYVTATGNPWMIMSARHYLVNPRLLLAPYDERLGVRARMSWARVVAELAYHLIDTGEMPPNVCILAGQDYARPVAEALGLRGIEAREPLRGLGLGARRQWLKTRKLECEARKVSQRA